MADQSFLQAALDLMGRPGNAVRTAIVHGPGSILQGLTGDIRTDPTELPGINQLPDEGPSLGPLHITPRTVGGVAAGTALDPVSYLGGPLLRTAGAALKPLSHLGQAAGALDDLPMIGKLSDLHGFDTSFLAPAGRVSRDGDLDQLLGLDAGRPQSRMSDLIQNYGHPTEDSFEPDFDPYGGGPTQEPGNVAAGHATEGAHPLAQFDDLRTQYKTARDSFLNREQGASLSGFQNVGKNLVTSMRQAGLSDDDILQHLQADMPESSVRIKPGVENEPGMADPLAGVDANRPQFQQDASKALSRLTYHDAGVGLNDPSNPGSSLGTAFTTNRYGGGAGFIPGEDTGEVRYTNTLSPPQKPGKGPRDLQVATRTYNDSLTDLKARRQEIVDWLTSTSTSKIPESQSLEDLVSTQHLDDPQGPSHEFDLAAGPGAKGASRQQALSELQALDEQISSKGSDVGGMQRDYQQAAGRADVTRGQIESTLRNTARMVAGDKAGDPTTVTRIYNALLAKVDDAKLGRMTEANAVGGDYGIRKAQSNAGIRAQQSQHGMEYYGSPKATPDENDYEALQSAAENAGGEDAALAANPGSVRIGSGGANTEDGRVTFKELLSQLMGRLNEGKGTEGDLALTQGASADAADRAGYMQTLTAGDKGRFDPYNGYRRVGNNQELFDDLPGMSHGESVDNAAENLIPSRFSRAGDKLAADARTRSGMLAQTEFDNRYEPGRQGQEDLLNPRTGDRTGELYNETENAQRQLLHVSSTPGYPTEYERTGLDNIRDFSDPETLMRLSRRGMPALDDGGLAQPEQSSMFGNLDLLDKLGIDTPKGRFTSLAQNPEDELIRLLKSGVSLEDITPSGMNPQQFINLIRHRAVTPAF